VEGEGVSRKKKPAPTMNEYELAVRDVNALFPHSPFGAFAGVDEKAGTVFVGVITESRRCLRFSGPTFEHALRFAAAWKHDTRNAWSVVAHGLEPGGAGGE